MAGKEVEVGPEPGGDRLRWFGGIDQCAGWDFDPEQDFDDEVGHYEGCDRVSAEDEPWAEEPFSCGIFVQTADVDEPVKEG